jgi:hypothetical protein
MVARGFSRGFDLLHSTVLWVSNNFPAQIKLTLALVGLPRLRFFGQVLRKKSLAAIALLPPPCGAGIAGVWVRTATLS